MELLRAFGTRQPIAVLDVNDREPYRPQQAYTLHEAVLPITAHPLSKQVISGLHRRFAAHCGDLSDTTLPKKLFINRRDMSNTNRILTNADDIAAICEQQGYCSVTMSELSIRDQMRLFHNADDIVFEHGAAGSFLLFSQPHARVTEILSPRNHSTSNAMADHYARVCMARNIEYNSIVGKIIATTPDTIEYAIDTAEFAANFGRIREVTR